MAYHIEKAEKIQDKVETIYYQGDHRWTTIFTDRKVYSDESEANSDLYFFGGTVIAE